MYLNLDHRQSFAVQRYAAMAVNLSFIDAGSQQAEDAEIILVLRLEVVAWGMMTGPGKKKGQITKQSEVQIKINWGAQHN